MNSDFNFLYKTFSVPFKTSNIDPKFFEYISDDLYKRTNFFIYKLSSLSKEFFKQAILRLDSDKFNLKYTSYVEKEKIDYNATNQNKSKYSNQYLIFEQSWNDYKQNHLEEFESRERIDSMDETSLSLSSNFLCDYNVSNLYDALQGYLAANQLSKEFCKGTDLYETLPKIEYLISKEEYKEKHKNQQEMLKYTLKIPSDDLLVVKKTENVHQLKRLKKADSTLTNIEPLEIYCDELTKYLFTL